jgi:signal peptide peptidase SppA
MTSPPLTRAEARERIGLPPVHDDAQAVAEFKALMADPAARQAFVDAKARAAESGAALRYGRVLRAVCGSPWAILPAYLAVIVDVVTYRVSGGRLSPDEIEARVAPSRRPDPPASRPTIAVLPVQGVIVPKAGGLNEMSGGTSVETLRDGLRSAVRDPDVRAIVMDVDSPGGVADGLPELAAEIRAARDVKPVYAFVESEGASAAYWLASQAHEVWSMRSSRVGSIGVYMVHESDAEKLASQGIEKTIVSAGRYKTEANPHEPLTDAGRASIQTMVDTVYDYFAADVAAGRGDSVENVRDGYGEGRVLMGEAARAAGLVDRVGTFDELVGTIVERHSDAPAVAAAAPSIGTATVAIQPVVLPPVAANGTPIPPDDVPDVPDPVPPPVAAVDNTAWDGGRAMAACNGAGDYRAICAGEKNVGDPDERQHWALPHHYLGRGPNAAGTRNALARLPQTEGLANREAARRHLEAHMREINPEAASGADVPDVVAETDERRRGWESVLRKADLLIGP